MRSSVASWHQEITVTRCDSAKARDGCSMKRQSIGKDTSTWQRLMENSGQNPLESYRIHWVLGENWENQAPKNTPGKAAHGKVSVGWRVVRDPKRIVAGPADYSHLPAKDTRSNVPEKRTQTCFGVVVCSLHKLVNADLGIKIADQFLVLDRNRTSPLSFLGLSSKKHSVLSFTHPNAAFAQYNSNFSWPKKYWNCIVFASSKIHFPPVPPSTASQGLPLWDPTEPWPESWSNPGWHKSRSVWQIFSWIL